MAEEGRPSCECVGTVSSSCHSTEVGSHAFHVRRERTVAKFRLEPMVLERAGGFSRRELSTIAKLVEPNAEQFLEDVLQDTIGAFFL